MVDNSSKMARMRVVSGLIFQRLRRKQAFFDPFPTCKGVDFPAVTEKAPEILAGGAVRFRSADFGMRIGENASQRLAPDNAG